MSLTTFQQTCFTTWPIYIIPKHYIIIVGFERDDQGHACSYFMGGLVITCTYFGRWVHLGFKTIPNLNFQISCIFSNDLKFGTRVDSHMPNDRWLHRVLYQFGLKFSKKILQKLKFRVSIREASTIISLFSIIHYSQTLVNRSLILAKASKIDYRFKIAENLLKHSIMALLCVKYCPWK